MFRTESRNHQKEILQALKIQSKRTKKHIEKSNVSTVTEFLKERLKIQQELIEQLNKELEIKA